MRRLWLPLVATIASAAAVALAWWSSPQPSVALLWIMVALLLLAVAALLLA